MKKSFLRSLAIVLWTLNLSSALQASWKVEQMRRGESISVLSVERSKIRISEPWLLLRSTPWMLDEGPKTSTSRYEELLYRDDQVLPDLYRPFLNGNFRKTLEPLEGAELRKILVQGPVENRINLTIVGDGYTLEEKDKFFADAQRTSDQLFKAKAFSSYLPLFNVYAVFVPSNESGITDLEKKDTALGLYRDPPGSKRAIMPGNTRAIEAALAVAPKADFPILIANDDFYGGLGGRYAITTRSLESGAVVLRHELGHNFGDVGEEYDGGYVSRGANFSSSKNVSWSKWAEDGIQFYESKFLSGAYVWQNLKSKPYSASFQIPKANEDGAYQLVMRVSSVGWETDEDVVVSVNGERVPLRGRYTADRSFFFLDPVSLEAGTYKIEVKENIEDGNNVLAFAELIANPASFDYTPEKIGAFATFNSNQKKVGYRPTNESCLMRNMLLDHFCVADRENFWVRFLNRVSLIDSVGAEGFLGARKVTVKTPPVRGLKIRWFAVEASGEKRELGEFEDQKSWDLPEGMRGKFIVEVKFPTPEVRSYTQRFAQAQEFTIQ